MSMQDDNLENKHDRTSAPESLGQVLNSLQSILEQKNFPLSNDAPTSSPIIEATECNEEFKDESLSIDMDTIPLLQTEEIAIDDMDIPVLNDVVFKGLSENAEKNHKIASQLNQLRNELDTIVENIMDEAQQQFESDQNPPTTENNMQRFLRELSQK